MGCPFKLSVDLTWSMICASPVAGQTSAQVKLLNTNVAFRRHYVSNTVVEHRGCFHLTCTAAEQRYILHMHSSKL